LTLFILLKSGGPNNPSFLEWLLFCQSFQVANFVYSRWNIAYPTLQEKLEEVHQRFVQEIKDIDQKALEIFHKRGHQSTVELLTRYSVDAGDKMHQDWIDFFGYLFARFRDFIVMEKDDANKECGCKPSRFF
jgi:hypothetical protein